MLPNKTFNNNNNNISNNSNTETSLLLTNNSSSAAAAFQTKRKNKMESNSNNNKPTSLSSNKPSTQGSMNQQHHHSHHSHHSHHQNESKLYVMSSIELRDALENTLEEAFNKLKHLITPSTQQPESVSINELSNYSNHSKAQYDEVCNALFYSILTDQPNSSRCLRNLFACNNLTFSFSSSSVSSSIGQSNMNSGMTEANSSSYGVLINNLNSIITENYQRLLDMPRQQLIWLLRELVKARVNQCERLLLQMLRHIQSGSLAEKNYWLAESMLDILSEVQVNTSNSDSTSNAGSSSTSSSTSLWIYSYNELMTQTLYTYLRVIADHGQAVALTQLRQRETEFCIQILREKWNDCMQIGRDLVRLLQNLAKISEFEQLWRDITTAPQLLSAQFAQLGGLPYLMRLPSRRRCLISRLTIDMERKVYFIITSVKAGQQKRYLEWFQRQYLNTPESQSLRVDIMRYICVVVHPTNEQLNSGLTPRWSLCVWLINTCTNQIESANLKLALFFDWLFYDAKKDNIMLIEPAILLMFNSIRPAAATAGTGGSNLSTSLTNSLFDFLCRIAVNYYWPLREQILNGIMQSFKDSVEKRVIPSMQVFFANLSTTESMTSNGAAGSNAQKPGSTGNGSILMPDLKLLIQNTFGNFFQTLNLNQTPLSPFIQSPTTTTSVQQQQPSVSPTPMLNSSVKPNNELPSFGSAQSLFKQQRKNSEPQSSDDCSSPASSFSDSPLVSGGSSPQVFSFQSYFSVKNEASDHSSTLSMSNMTPIKTETNNLLNSNDFTSLAKTEQFSSDEDEEQQQPITKQQQLNNTENQTILQFKQNPMVTPTPSMSYLIIQKQLQAFTSRPFKIFTTIDDNSSILNTNNSNTLENHLNLIQSDDLRDKLTELNEKILSVFPSQDQMQPQQQPFYNINTLGNNSFSYLSTMFKEILAFIQKDQEFLNNFNTSLTDLAVSICLILKSDFTNQLLPAQLYATPGTNGTTAPSAANKSTNRQSNGGGTFSSDQLLNGSNTNGTNLLTTLQSMSLFSPSSACFNLIHEQSLNQRLIFILFKELSLTTNQSSSREILMQLLHEIYLKQNRVGYYFLFYIYLMSLKASAALNGSGSSTAQLSSAQKAKQEVRTLIEIYLEFTKERRNEIKIKLNAAKSNVRQYSDDDDLEKNSADDSDKDSESENVSDDDDNENNSADETGSSSDSDDEWLAEEDLMLGECYMQDVRLCQQDDPYLFCFLLPFIVRDLHEYNSNKKATNFMLNNSDLCYLISSCIDAKQLKDLISSITSQELVLLKEPKSTEFINRNSNELLSKTGRINGNSKKITRSNSSNNNSDLNNKKRKRTNDLKQLRKVKDCKLVKTVKKKKKNKANKKNKVKPQGLRKKHLLTDVLEASLAWESIEQIFFWQLLIAHDEIQINNLLPLYSKLEASNHAEANYHLFQLLKTSEPSFDLVKFLVNRRLDENMEKALFVHWTRRISSGELKMAQIFSKLLNKSAVNTQQLQATTLKKIKYNESFTNNKKLTAEQQLEIANQQKAASSKQNSGKLNAFADMNQMPSLDQVLFCLNKLRLNNECIKFILKENILEALQKVYKKYCDDEMKKKYGDLFTLADEFNENSSSGSGRRNDNGNDEDDDEEENEQDEDENNESENSSNDDNENSDNETQNDSDSNEAIAVKGKKIKSSPRTTKNSMNKGISRSNSTAKATVSTKRTIKSSNSKSNNKKQKLKNSNSSDSEKDENTRTRRSKEAASESDESNNSDSESDSSNERKKVNKSTRKKS